METVSIPAGRARGIARKRIVRTRSAACECRTRVLPSPERACNGAAHGLAAAFQLAVNYRGSPIVAENRGGWLAALGSGREAARSQHAFGTGPHPGDRSPDVALRPEPRANTTWDRLSSALTGPHHHLLFFEGLAAKPPTLTDWKTIEAMIESKYQYLILPWHDDDWGVPEPEFTAAGEFLIDPDGSLHRGYGARSACLYLLRPDGYIGYRALPPDAPRLRAYLERLLI